MWNFLKMSIGVMSDESQFSLDVISTWFCNYCHEIHWHSNIIEIIIQKIIQISAGKCTLHPLIASGVLVSVKRSISRNGDRHSCVWEMIKRILRIVPHANRQLKIINEYEFINNIIT